MRAAVSRKRIGVAWSRSRRPASVGTTGRRSEPVIASLACSLVGHEGALTVTPGSMAEELLGVDRTVERYHCSYGLNPAYTGVLEAHGMRFTGHDGADARIAELPGHPFYLATLFQPELAGESGYCHPVVRGFAEAAVRRARTGPRVAG